MSLQYSHGLVIQVNLFHGKLTWIISQDTSDKHTCLDRVKSTGAALVALASFHVGTMEGKEQYLSIV